LLPTDIGAAPPKFLGKPAVMSKKHLPGPQWIFICPQCGHIDGYNYNGTPTLIVVAVCRTCVKIRRRQIAIVILILLLLLALFIYLLQEYGLLFFFPGLAA
jgi:hypothetical protein